MVRKLAIALASLGLITSTNVGALGLGEIELHSALNQPLNADIKMHSVYPGELDGVKVELASSQAFQQAGLDRPQWMSQFRFKVDRDATGQPRIKVTSSQPVREPFVTFLVEVNWASGRVVREYTLLLDPPEFVAGSRAPVVIPRTAARAEAPAAAAPRTGEARPATSPASPTQAAAGAGKSYGPVKPTDTLWSIASQMRPDASVEVEQMMLALVRANPEAFNDGNVNRLKKGYVLRAPQSEVIASIGRAEALREVRRQNAAWQEVRRAAAGAPVPAPATVAEKPADAGEKSAAPAAEQKGPRLKLVPAEPDKAKEAPGVIATAEQPEKPAPSQTEASLQQQLALANETAAARQQENAELRTRMAELEAQMAEVQRLIEIKNNEIAALQSRLQAMQQTGAQAPQQAPAPAAEQPKPTPKPAAQQAPGPVEEPATGGLLSDLLNSPLFLLLGAMVVLVAGALAWVAARRRRMMMESTFQESILMPQPAVAGAAPAAAGAAAAGGAESTSFLNDSMISDVGVISAEVDETDPLAEADIYMAYGRYQQAEELIGRALEKEPQRVDLKVKMLEVHFATKDKKAFESLAQELHTDLGGEHSPVWDKIVVMGRELCLESPLFGGAAVADETVAESLVEETSLAADETAPVEVELGSVENHGDEQSGRDVLEFDLDFHAQEPVAEAPAESEAGMDFSSLGMGLDAGSSGEQLSVAEQEPAEPAATTQNEGAEAGAPVLEFEFDKQGLEWPGEGFADAGTPEQSAPAVESDSSAWQDSEQKEEAGDFLSSFDEVGTKLDLAKVYIDMGDADSARSILNEVLEEGNDDQKREAQELLGQVA